MGQRAVRLTDDQNDFIAVPVVACKDNTLAIPRMKAVADDRFVFLIPGSMSLLRPARARARYR
jgi:hypothetical protein